jgi:hypothetical protein
LAAGFIIAKASLVEVRVGLLALACLIAIVRFKVDASLVILAAGAVGLFLG